VIDQSGDHNVVGYGTSGDRVLQTGNYNSASISQEGGPSGGNYVYIVRQTDATGTATALTNVLNIHQEGAVAGDYASPASGSDYKFARSGIGTVIQNWTGEIAAQNLINITQDGGIHNRYITVAKVEQDRTGSTGTITQTGHS